MKLLTLILILACALSSCKESKSERITRLNKLIKLELDYQESLGKQLSDDSVHNAELFKRKQESDRKEDSLTNEIRKIESE